MRAESNGIDTQLSEYLKRMDEGDKTVSLKIKEIVFHREKRKNYIDNFINSLQNTIMSFSLENIEKELSRYAFTITDIDFLYNKALAQEKKGNIQNALVLYYSLAALGCKKAEYTLFNMGIRESLYFVNKYHDYDKGGLTEELSLNLNDNTDNLIKKAEQGDIQAQYQLGEIYLEGKEVSRSEAKAFYCFLRAALGGESRAQNYLGDIYSKGRGVEINFEEALQWYLKSAEQENPDAQNSVGNRYFNGEGVEKDFIEAVKWYRRSAEHNNPNGQKNLAYCYKNGIGLEKNYEKALDFYEKSALQGNDAAQLNLGNCYYNGQGVEKDYSIAVKWYKKAADAGNDNAQYYLAKCFENGIGVKEDYNEAINWYKKAAIAGNVKAHNRICSVSVLTEFIAHENGTILALDGSNKAFVKAEKKFFFHGVKLSYTVEEIKNDVTFIDVVAIDYSDVIERVTRLKGYSLEEAKQIKSAYVEANGYRKAFSEILGNKFSEEEKESLKRVFYGFSFIKTGAKKVASFGVTWKALEELFERFGFRAFIQLKENPYDCVGGHMDFEVANRIFFDSDIGFEKACRLQALKIIGMLKADKHTYVGCIPYNKISDRYKGAICTMSRIGHVMEEKALLDHDVLKNFHLFAFKDKAMEERTLAELINKRKSSPAVLVPEEKIEKFREKLVKEGVNLSSGQSTALDIAKFTGLACLTGGPGTGKTTVVRNTLRVIEENIPNTVVKLSAPTGKAAKRLSESTEREAVTVHRLLEMDQRGSCRRNEQRNIEADIVVVDEASMMDTVLTIKLMKALPAKCLLILVGDVNQLPPVEAGQVFSDLIQTGKCRIYRLYETMRQKEGSVLLTNINAIRDYHIDLIEKPGEFEVYEFDSPQKASYSLLETAKSLYREKGLLDFQLLVARHEGTTGTNLLNSKLQSLLNPNKRGSDSPFVKGDKIIFTKNNYKAGYLNGDIGIVVDDSETGIEIDVVGGGNIFVPVEKFKNLDLAYAITVRQAQGNEYPIVMVGFIKDDSMIITRNWIYTAICCVKQICLVYKEKGVYPVGDNGRKTLLPLFL